LTLPSLKKQLSGDKEKGPATKGEEKSGKLVGLENGALGTYAECYPGGFEEMDATYDSDEDADYTKMDLGNKKGPVKRWDFENEEDYASYQSNREALPKAAFQYGVKMNEGRKTRRSKGGKNEMAKINREWQQISAILSKRKGGGDERSSAAKRAKED
jgi:IK cytokine